jgi:hypothetical protein
MLLKIHLAGPAMVLALAASVAGAQTAPVPAPSPRQACMSSIKTLCQPELTAHDRAAVKACLIKNFDKTSPECQAAMKAAQAAKTEDAAPTKP